MLEQESSMPKRPRHQILNRFGLLHPAISVRNRIASVGRGLSDHARLAVARASSTSTDTATRQLIAVGPDSSRRPVLARVGTDHRSTSVLCSNLELVTSILERGSVRFQVSGDDVFVTPEARHRAIAAIAEADSTVYVMANKTGRVTPANKLSATTDLGDLLTVFEHHAASTGALVHGPECGCRIQFSEPTVPAPSTPYDFPVDVVYTWVDGSDPAWRRRRIEAIKSVGRDDAHPEATSEARFTSLDELRYSLRSLERYGDFVRHIYLVTDGQVPPWLRLDHPDLTLVPHSTILPEDALPTFNSHAIEACLHRIPGLSEQYLYLNDDFFFARRATKADYFDEHGRSRSFPSTARAPDGPVTPATRPVDAAAINVRSLIATEFDIEVPSNKFQHAPYAQRRCVHAEIERRFARQIRQTIAARFRSSNDIAIASALHQHVAELTGFGVRGALSSGYVDLAAPHLGERLRLLGQSPDLQTFCLNDSDHPTISADRKASMVRAHLEHMFPGPSRFER
jgi:hypothetical protein